MSSARTQTTAFNLYPIKGEIKKPILQLAANSSRRNEVLKTAEKFASKNTAATTEQERKSSLHAVVFYMKGVKSGCTVKSIYGL